MYNNIVLPYVSISENGSQLRQRFTFLENSLWNRFSICRREFYGTERKNRSFGQILAELWWWCIRGSTRQNQFAWQHASSFLEFRASRRVVRLPSNSIRSRGYFTWHVRKGIEPFRRKFLSKFVRSPWNIGASAYFIRFGKFSPVILYKVFIDRISSFHDLKLHLFRFMERHREFYELLIFVLFIRLIRSKDCLIGKSNGFRLERLKIYMKIDWKILRRIK